MPVEAPAELPNVPLAGTVSYRREYRDILGRPLTGSVTITGQARTEVDGRVVLPLPVEVEIVNGVLDLHLPPDVYQLRATLRTTEGVRTSDEDTVTLS